MKSDDDSVEIQKYIAERGLTRCPTRLAGTKPESTLAWRMELRAGKRGETDANRGENGR